MAELGLITYQTEYDPQIGCNISDDIHLHAGTVLALDVSGRGCCAARRSRGRMGKSAAQKSRIWSRWRWTN
ncbi:hypothetical protein A464_plas0005 (plasmid) [Salmonella bongori N268-08]|uniref:Uncharacterized protein n=1 Tax=Salmonella bongori N268-08 TaxID=1197719 RepID=S5N4M8_SALBN|nr:hypothetical protein A464_plas0005 [Salmonella bongori N268-08]